MRGFIQILNFSNGAHLTISYDVVVSNEMLKKKSLCFFLFQSKKYSFC